MVTALVKKKRALIGIALSLGLQSCGCDGVGCRDGLFVRLSSLPPAPFKVELLVKGQVQAAPDEATCNVGASRPCVNVIYFAMRPRDDVSVRVTTPSGVRTTELSRISYQDHSGSFCSGCKGQAEVTAQLP